MLKSKKNVFWEALLLTIVLFVFGLLIGVGYENSRLEKINEYYAVSEISLMDIFVLGNNVDLGNVGCEGLINSNIEFANRIYNEAIVLEQYEAAGRITDNLKLAHKKYDLMRTFLWANSIKIFEKCEKDFDIIIYLYEYETSDLTKKATQNVWSKVLFDLKQERGDNMLLTPIAADANLVSLNLLIDSFEIGSYPVVIINNEKVINDLNSVGEINNYLL